MSILTKIAIVLLVVVSIAASVVFINMATVPRSFRRQLQSEQSRSEALAAGLRRAQLATNRMSYINAMNQANSLGRIASLQTQVEGLEDQISTLQQNNRDLAVEKNEHVAQVSQLAAALETEQQQTEAVSAQLQDALAKKDELAKLNREYSQTNTRLAGQIEKLEKQVQVRLEEIAQLEDRIVDLRETIEDLRANTTIVAGPGPDGQPDGTGELTATEQKITGTVTSVREGIASIDVGSASGITKGQRFVIYRADNFVSYLDIAVVRATESAGHVVKAKLQPKIGDRVTNKLAR